MDIERLKRIKRCAILFLSVILVLALLAAQFLRLRTPQGMTAVFIIAIIGVGFLIYFVLHVYKDLCGMEKPNEEQGKR
jgi:hypothetical protein